MLPDPLHPSVVHFPIVLTFLLPISVIAAIWVIRKSATPRRVWSAPLAIAAALWLSAFVATRTGENEEDRVESVVASEAVIHDHEESAERFLLLSGVLLLVAGTGLFGGVVGRAGRLVTAAGALGLVGAAYQVGHSGGELVYRHGAAAAYVEGAPQSADLARAGSDDRSGRRGDGEDDDR